jgi:hypothetical protein
MNLPNSPSLASKPPLGGATEASTPMQILATTLKVFGFGLLVLVLAIGLQSALGFRLIASGSIFLLLAVLIKKFPSVGMIATFSFLVIMGGIRRWLIPDFGWLSYDPLILIAPAITLLFFLMLVVSRKLPGDTKLSRCLKLLLFIMAIQVVNPLQGGFMVGFGGILYYVIPVLWFYFGRSYGSEANGLKLLTVALFVYTATGIYGLKQVFFGLSASEQSWVEASGYVALNMSDGAIRVFSTFASTQEYAATLACAISICCAYLFQRKTQFVFPLLILVPALLYTGTRGPVATVLLAVCLQWALLGRQRSVWLPRLGLALFLGVGGLVWSLSRVDTGSLTTQQSAILSHQQEGLLNPAESTGPAHIITVFEGIFSGIKQPWGLGLGATTMAASKLGTGGVASSEFDVSNLFISLGIVGGFIYAYMVFITFKNLIALWNKTRHITYLITLGILVVAIGQWLNGGLYSLCLLIWFLIGIMDRVAATTLESPSPSKKGKIGIPSRWKKKKVASRRPMPGNSSGRLRNGHVSRI